MLSDDDVDFLAHPYGVEFVGPFVEEWRITSKGYRVPHLTIQPIANDPDGDTCLTLDGRIMLVADGDEIRKWIPFLADAMAVAAGYSCHGEQCRPINLYRVRMSALPTEQPGGRPTGNYDATDAPVRQPCAACGHLITPQERVADEYCIYCTGGHPQAGDTERR